MSKKIERVILFNSTSHAIRAQRLLRENGFKIKVIPTPRKYSSNCGIAIKFAKEIEGEVITSIEKRGIKYEGPYDI